MSCKQFVRKMFNKVGYDVYKFRNEKEYTASSYAQHYIFSPWLEDKFQELYGKVSDHTVVSEDRCYIIQKLCLHALHTDGDFAECGVYKGGTAFIIAQTLNTISIQDKKFHLFDTFAGMPAIADEDPSNHNEGDFGDSSLDAIRTYLQKFSFINFHPGIIPETFEVEKDLKFAFVHIDVDLYHSVWDCCDFFYNRMSQNGIMLFDDYGFPGYKHSAKKAVDDFFRDKLECPIILRTGQCFAIKL